MRTTERGDAPQSTRSVLTGNGNAALPPEAALPEVGGSGVDRSGGAQPRSEDYGARGEQRQKRLWGAYGVSWPGLIALPLLNILDPRFPGACCTGGYFCILRLSQNFGFWKNYYEKCVFRSLQTNGSLARNRKRFPKSTGFWENLYSYKNTLIYGLRDPSVRMQFERYKNSLS